MSSSFADWLVDMVDIQLRYYKDQSRSLTKLVWIEVQLLWRDLKIAWYS